MLKTVLRLLLAILLFASTSAFACDVNVACDKCAKASEFSWNPRDEFVTARLSRFYSLGDQIAKAYEADDFGKVDELARENLELASVYRCNWNFGNAIHDTNRVLGLSRLRSGDVDGAAEYLLKAGKSTGSPQLDTFGPELDLANALLQLGKVDAVRFYLKDIQRFWKMNDGQVDAWLAEIDSGGKPQLDRFANRSAGPWLMALFYLTMAWPLIVSGAVLFARGRRIARKLLFLVIAAPSGYVVMYAGALVAAYAVQAIVSSMEDLGDTTLLLVASLPSGIMLLLPALTIYLLARFFQASATE